MYFTSVKQIVDSNQMIAFSEMTDSERRQEISNIARNGAVIDTINRGYKESLEQSERQHREEMDMLADNTRQLERNNELVSNQNYKLGEISNLLYDTNVILNTGFRDLSIKAQSLVKLAEINSSKMDKLIEVMRIPDYEKERLFKFAKANEYLRQSIKFPERMDDAIEILEEIYKVDTRDPLVLNKLGNCYLHSTKHANLVRSKELLERAINYTDSKFDDNKNLLKYDNYINYAYVNMLLDPSYVISIDELTNIINNTLTTKSMDKTLYNLVGVSLFRSGNLYTEYHDEVMKLMLTGKNVFRYGAINNMVLDIATSIDTINKTHNLGDEPTEPIVMALLSTYYKNRDIKNKTILENIDSCRSFVLASTDVITAAKTLHNSLKDSIAEIDAADIRRIEEKIKRKQEKVSLKAEEEAELNDLSWYDEESDDEIISESEVKSTVKELERRQKIGKVIMWVLAGFLFLLIRSMIKG